MARTEEVERTAYRSYSVLKILVILVCVVLILFFVLGGSGSELALGG